MLGLHGAEIVFVPSATTTGHSDNLWKIEQTSMAIANGYFVGTNNRVGREAPWNFGEFYGSRTSAIPTARSCPRAAATRTSWWWPTSTSTSSRRCARTGSSTGTAGPESYGDIAKDVL